MVEKNLVGLIWLSFRRVQGPLLAVLAIILAIVLWQFSPNKKVGLDIILPIGILVIVLIITLFESVYEALKMNRYILPKMILGREMSSQLICILEPSPLFSHDALVSFYFNDGFEQFVGFGRVINVQEDGKIQVILINSLPDHSDIIKKLSLNDSTILSKMIVKPTVPMSIQNYLSSGGE